MPRATAKVIPKCLFDCPSINREVSTTTLVEYSIGKLFCGHAGGEESAISFAHASRGALPQGSIGFQPVSVSRCERPRETPLLFRVLSEWGYLS
jgi:hypothetical protein